MKQTIRVLIYPEHGPARIGFQVTARLESNDRAQAGYFEAGEQTIVQVKDGIQYVSHKGPLLSSSDPLQDFPSFSWTPPPASAGRVRFYVAAVAGDGNGTPEGNVYTAASTYAPATHDLPPGFRWQTISISGATTVVPRAISSNGLIAGNYQTNTAGAYFIRNLAGEITTFQFPGALNLSGINASGNVVGWIAGSQGKGFIREPGGTASLLAIPGAGATELQGISDSGVLAGVYYERLPQGFRDYMFLKAGPSDPQTFFFDPSYNTVFGITSTGVLYGGWTSSPTVFVRSLSGEFSGHSVCRSLYPGTLIWRQNDYGQAVRWCGDDLLSVGPRFLTAETGRTILTRNSSIYWDFSPLDINNAGQIVGYVPGKGGVLLTPCAATPQETNITVARQGGTHSIGITSDYPDCRPNVVATGVEPFQQPGSVTFNATPNVNALPKNWTMWVAGRTVTIKQPGLGCTSSPSAQLFGSLIGAAGGQAWLSVSLTPGCPPWTLQSSASWLTPSSTSGDTGGTVTLTASATTAQAARLPSL